MYIRGYIWLPSMRSVGSRCLDSLIVFLRKGKVGIVTRRYVRVVSCVDGYES